MVFVLFHNPHPRNKILMTNEKNKPSCEKEGSEREKGGGRRRKTGQVESRERERDKEKGRWRKERQGGGEE